MSELKRKVRAWVAAVVAACDNGGYPAGDGPVAPLEEMEWLLAEVNTLRSDLAIAREWLRRLDLQPCSTDIDGNWDVPELWVEVDCTAVYDLTEDDLTALRRLLADPESEAS